MCIHIKFTLNISAHKTPIQLIPIMHHKDKLPSSHPYKKKKKKLLNFCHINICHFIFIYYINLLNANVAIQ
jgi:hypothetical protein